MTPVLILILVVLWMVILAPPFIKKRLEHRSTQSIDSFHYSLHLLERSGPKLVNPAYRLDTAQSTTGVAPGQSGFPAVSSMPGRPNLVLLQPVGQGLGDAAEEVVDEVSGQHYLRMPPTLVPDPATGATNPPSLAARAMEYRSEQARRRRRDILLALAGTVTLTALLGIVRPLHPLWVVTVLAGVALAGYIALAAYAQVLAGAGRPGSGRGWASGYAQEVRRAATGRRVPRARERGAAQDWEYDDRADPGHGDPYWAARQAATAGFPGAWDEEYAVSDRYGTAGHGLDQGYDEPRRAVGGG